MGIFKDLKHFQYMIHIATGVWPPPLLNYEFYNLVWTIMFMVTFIQFMR